jgi:hypothetical protein
MMQTKVQPVHKAETLAASLRRRSAGQVSREFVVAQQREQLLRRILEDIRAASSIEEAVERAITALGREMDASEVLVRLGSEAELLSCAPEVGDIHASGS